MAKDKDQSTPTSYKESVAKNDAYTGMLAISLVILVVGAGLLFLDYFRYSGTPPRVPQRQMTPVDGGPKDAPAPNPGAPKGGGAKKGGA